MMKMGERKSCDVGNVFPIAKVLRARGAAAVAKEAAIIFVKLFPMRMVERSRWGLDRSFRPNLAPLLPSSVKALRRLSVTEKNAISAPEKKAESPMQIRTAIKSIDGLTCSDREDTGVSNQTHYVVIKTRFARRLA